MRVSLVVAGGFAVIACGSSASTTHDAAVTAADAVADLTLGADAPSCAMLPCLEHANAIIAACAPAGACTKETTSTPGASTTMLCFANGVKIALSGVRTASGGTTMVMDVRKDGGACYSFTTDAESAQVGAAVYRDGAGVDLVSESADGPTSSVACPGAQAIVPDGSCDAALYALGGLYPFTNATCTAGTCAF